VDGRNPAPVDRWFIPLFRGVQPSKVGQDFFHPPYPPRFVQHPWAAQLGPPHPGDNIKKSTRHLHPGAENGGAELYQQDFMVFNDV
jgi:hypothetical protein